jgi:hypothetical protein
VEPVRVVANVEKDCRCKEGVLQYTRPADPDANIPALPRIDAPPVHNCQYVRDRESLVNTAVSLASRRVGSSMVGFDRAFVEIMDELYRKQQLQRAAGEDPTWPK